MIFSNLKNSFVSAAAFLVLVGAARVLGSNGAVMERVP